MLKESMYMLLHPVKKLIGYFDVDHVMCLNNNYDGRK